MTLRELLVAQEFDVDELLDTQIGEFNSDRPFIGYKFDVLNGLEISIKGPGKA